MKFGISALIFGHDDVIPYIPLLKQYGVEYIELRGYPPRIEYNNKEYIFRLKDELERNNIGVHSFHLQFNKLDISGFDEVKRKDSVDEVLRSLKLCKEIGCDIAVLHPGAKYVDLDKKEQAERNSIESIRTVLEEAEKSEILLAVENMLPGRVSEDYGFFEKLFNEISSPNLGMCFDSSHANINGIVYKLLRQMKGNLSTVHFSDNFGKSDEHLYPFDGNIDWEKILKVLDDIAFDNIFMIEAAVEPDSEPEDRLKKYCSTIEKIERLL